MMLLTSVRFRTVGLQRYSMKCTDIFLTLVFGSIAPYTPMYGSFEFSPSTSKIDIDALVARYADPEYWLQALTDSETSIE